MGKKLGNDYRLWIESAVAGTYNEIKGQTSLKINRQAGSIDTSTKDDYPYGTQAPGLKTLTIDAEVYPNLPDANGYTRLETLSKGSAPVKFQIRKGGSAGAAGDVVYEASQWIGNFDTDFGKNDVVKSTFQLTLDGAPTTDALA
ncbi:MAG: phage tail tube protein [Sphingobium sp.]|nr:phage tail tube protein [Sphingobium sp.]